jgi:hypothetical protein
VNETIPSGGVRNAQNRPSDFLICTYFLVRDRHLGTGIPSVCHSNADSITDADRHSGTARLSMPEFECAASQPSSGPRWSAHRFYG